MGRNSLIKEYWFEDVYGKRYYKKFKTQEEAQHYFFMSGDRMFKWGRMKEET